MPKPSKAYPMQALQDKCHEAVRLACSCAAKLQTHLRITSDESLQPVDATSFVQSRKGVVAPISGSQIPCKALHRLKMIAKQSEWPYRIRVVSLLFLPNPTRMSSIR